MGDVHLANDAVVASSLHLNRLSLAHRHLPLGVSLPDTYSIAPIRRLSRKIPKSFWPAWRQAGRAAALAPNAPGLRAVHLRGARDQSKSGSTLKIDVAQS